VRIYGGFLRRAGALAIDWLLLFPVCGILAAGRPAALVGVAYLALPWLYFSAMESSRYQATLGKLVFAVVVTDLDGNRISFGRATARYWSSYLSLLTAGVGFLLAAFTERQQALHDMLGGTMVVRRPAGRVRVPEARSA
jgi:uncharacterized RDD family membrane protein YckC